MYMLSNPAFISQNMQWWTTMVRLTRSTTPWQEI